LIVLIPNKTPTTALLSQDSLPNQRQGVAQEPLPGFSTTRVPSASERPWLSAELRLLGIARNKHGTMLLGGRAVFAGEASPPLPIGWYLPNRLLQTRANGSVNLFVIGCVVYGTTIDSTHHHTRFAYRLDRIDRHPLTIPLTGIEGRRITLVDLFPNVGSEVD